VTNESARRRDNRRRVVFILADGLSSAMLQFALEVDRRALEASGLGEYGLGLAHYRALWPVLGQRSLLDVASSPITPITSARQAARIETGMPSAYLAHQHGLEERPNPSLCRALHQAGVGLAFVTNSLVGDSTLGGLLCPHLSPMYDRKQDPRTPSNQRFQHAAASDLLESPWNLIIGGGRDYFRPLDAPDPLVSYAKGNRPDGRDLLQELRVAGGTVVLEDRFRESIPGIQDRKVLCAVDHLYPKYVTQRLRYMPEAVSLTEMVTRALRLLEESEYDSYFLFVEAGRIDHAAHENNAYVLLGELLELWEIIRRLRSTKELQPLTLVVTSDHGTGGLAMMDDWSIPYNAWSGEGIGWVSGPGVTRSDALWCGQTAGWVQGFNPSPGMKNFRMQPSALVRRVAHHERSPVPLLVSGPEQERFRDATALEDLHHVIMGLFLGGQSRKGKVVVVTGPAAAGKSTISRQLRGALQQAEGPDHPWLVLKGDAYLAGAMAGSPDWGASIFDLVATSLMNDAASLARNGVSSIVDFVFATEHDLNAIDAVRQTGVEVQVIVLLPSKQTLEVRDFGRPEDERMGRRCAELHDMVSRLRGGFERLDALTLEENLSTSDVVDRLLGFCRRTGVPLGKAEVP